jgi:hypothetical protein
MRLKTYIDNNRSGDSNHISQKAIVDNNRERG